MLKSYFRNLNAFKSLNKLISIKFPKLFRCMALGTYSIYRVSVSRQHQNVLQEATNNADNYQRLKWIKKTFCIKILGDHAKYKN